MILFILLIVFLSFYACHPVEPYVYSGNDADLYTEAIYSILGADGMRKGLHGYLDIFLDVIDQDEYGRRLFAYSEGFIINSYPSFLFVSQKTENGMVYYYPDYNFIISDESQSSQDEEVSSENANDKQKSWWKLDFPDNQIDELKQVNDWGKEINIEKCISQVVVQQKEDPLNKTDKNALYEEFLGEHRNDGYVYVIYSTKDDEGKLLYYMRDRLDSVHDYRMLIVDGDAHYCQKITDPTAYQEELAAFKREHNWKKS